MLLGASASSTGPSSVRPPSPPAAFMALPSASLSRFDFGGHRRIADIFHGNSGRVLIRGTRQAKLHQNVFRFGTRCLLNDKMPGSSNSPLSTASTITYDSSKIVSHNLHEVLSDYIHGLIIADIDPATAKLAITIAGPFLSAFGFLFIIRIVMSWYPKLPVKKFPFVVAYAPTEPFLSITRKVIPPLGGVDVTPVVWFGLVSFLNEILVGPQGLLVLLSQKV
ncbi:protein COFACTOR ASSEMBLY OF COMPLEX C SUBUNIT B CCB3, chloroplastic-like [Zingiber officinale]|uniref:Protein COFACTOR ASSEMBLY OF COMPLEX C SUBUNIT B CCB3, chloroplastic n=1 Tax=Zingiber officinale TaxID=94328 RepID=A0A8J5FNE4_ZINOF|nr:protein COFACTOR ASSEMBLY OF COMPLEX C SUBUNIT B CCB3, chloroplastic-like [Zingiber officinale]KAG6488451.1 hypothetical protein ZIOFF_049694 [Zingiber officinale]